MNSRRIHVLSLFFWLPLLVAIAQSQPPRGDYERFYGMREALSELPHRDILELLHHPPIREHLGIQEQDVQELDQQARKSFDVLRDTMHEAREKELSKSEVKELLLNKLTPLGDAQFQLIRDKYGEDKFRRLLGLYVQSRGISAAANTEVAKHIELSGQALLDFQRARRKVWDEGRDEMGREIRKILEGQSKDVGDEMGRVFRKYEHKRNAKLSPLLTPAQRQALEDLKGEPFADLPKRGQRPPDSRRNGSHSAPRGGEGNEPADGNAPCPNDEGKRPGQR